MPACSSAVMYRLVKVVFERDVGFGALDHDAGGVPFDRGCILYVAANGRGQEAGFDGGAGAYCVPQCAPLDGAGC